MVPRLEWCNAYSDVLAFAPAPVFEIHPLARPLSGFSHLYRHGVISRSWQTRASRNSLSMLYVMKSPTIASRHTRRAFASLVVNLGLLSTFLTTFIGRSLPVSADPATSDVRILERSALSTLEMIDNRQMKDAEPRLTEFIDELQKRDSAAAVLSVLYKYRADIRVRLGKLKAAQQDLTLALQLRDSIGMPLDDEAISTVCLGEEIATEYCVVLPSQPDILLQRARLSMQLGGKSALQLAEADLSRIIEEADGLQPYTHLFRGDTRMSLGDYEAAAMDYSLALRDFGSIRDEASREVARAAWAIALYGQPGKEQEGVKMMQEVLIRSVGVNGEIELLLPLAARQAAVHVAQAAHAWSEGRTTDAESQWEDACALIEASAVLVDGERDPRQELLICLFCMSFNLYRRGVNCVRHADEH